MRIPASLTAPARSARAAMRTSRSRVGDLARGGRGDLEQRLLGGAAARRLAAALDREHADQLLAVEQRQRGVGDRAVGLAQERGRAALRGLAVDAAAGRHAVLAAEVAARERGRHEAQAARGVLDLVDRRDPAARARGDPLAQPPQAVRERLAAGEDRADLLDRGIARRLERERLVLLRARDDLRVEARELLGEREVVVAERVRARAVVQVQHAEHAAVVQERHRHRRLDVEPLAHDPEALAIGLAAQAQRPALGRDAPGDPFAERHADLRPQLALDADRDAHRELAARLVDAA